MNKWEIIRKEEFDLSKEYVYMNNSTLGVTLNRVWNRMAEVSTYFSQGLSIDLFVKAIVPKLQQLQDNVKRILTNNSPQEKNLLEVGFINSATEGMSLVANGLTFKEGDTILITDHEHDGAEWPWQLQWKRYKAKVIKIPLVKNDEEGEQWKEGLIQRFRNACKENPVKVISFPWITTSTGHILPVKELVALAKEYDAYSVVDAAQAWAVLPINFPDVDSDFLVMNGHKYLCGPIGSGFLIVNERMLKPEGKFWGTVVDKYTLKINDLPFSQTAPYYKGGVAPYTNILPLKDALDFYQETGPGEIYERLLKIGQWLREGLSRYPDKFELVTPVEPEFSCIMTCFKVKGIDSDTVFQKLRDSGIQVKYATEGGADDVRISAHYYNTEKEFNALVDNLCAIASVDQSDWPAFPD